MRINRTIQYILLARGNIHICDRPLNPNAIFRFQVRPFVRIRRIKNDDITLRSAIVKIPIRAEPTIVHAIAKLVKYSLTAVRYHV
jgi:uncharacterized Rmd1/YagE family protein